MKLLFFFGLFLIFLDTYAQRLKLDRSRSEARFEVKNAGIWVEGRFGIPEVVKVHFDENDLKNSYIEAEIEVGSITTDNKTRDRNLLEELYFDAAKHPTIYFKSQKIERNKDKYEVTVQLRIKYATKTFQIPLEVRTEGGKKIFTSRFTIDRLDYGVGKSSWVLGDHVKVNLIGIFTIEP